MNIQAVADRARVSTATVSRTINGSNKVAPKTAERVRRAIEALGYYPNTNARALGSGRSRIYGLIISDITNPFFPELVKSFEDLAVRNGYEVIVANTGYSPERTEICVQRMLERDPLGRAALDEDLDPVLLVGTRDQAVHLHPRDAEMLGSLGLGEPVHVAEPGGPDGEARVTGFHYSIRRCTFVRRV